MMGGTGPVLAAMLAVPLFLSGCAELGEIRSDLRNYGREGIDRRIDLRGHVHDAQDQTITILKAKAITAASDGEADSAIEQLKALEQYVRSIYPDIPALINEARRIRDAFEGGE